jgi:hypothetical protein
MDAWSPERQQAMFELHYAPFEHRATGDPDPQWRHGWEIGLGSCNTTRVLPFLLTWSSDLALRVLDSKSFALSVVQMISVGLALGPLEPHVGGGLSTITGEVVHTKWSVAFFSPRAQAGLSLHLGGLRISADAYDEYLGRWFGGRSYLVRGLAFGVAFETSRPRPLTSRGRPP